MWEIKKTRLSKGKARKKPPCNISSHKVFETFTVAENSGKECSVKAPNSECSDGISKLVSLLGSLSHQLLSLQKNVCYTRKSNVDMKDNKVVTK